MADSPSASRPLSPHLGIYRKMLTMMMSIVHRITGAALYFGTLLLAWWLITAASGAEAYEVFSAHAGSWYGRIVLFGYTWALIHHMLGGLRHLVWDMGKGFNLRLVEWMARATVAGSVILTLVVWVIAYQMMGAL
jgi:succinate dehydrogenase / fumarate reductase cytochrome b subunit